MSDAQYGNPIHDYRYCRAQYRSAEDMLLESAEGSAAERNALRRMEHWRKALALIEPDVLALLPSGPALCA